MEKREERSLYYQCSPLSQHQLLLAESKQGAGLNVSSDHSHWSEMPDMQREGGGRGGGVSEGGRVRRKLNYRRRRRKDTDKRKKKTVTNKQQKKTL